MDDSAAVNYTPPPDPLENYHSNINQPATKSAQYLAASDQLPMSMKAPEKVQLLEILSNGN